MTGKKGCSGYGISLPIRYGKANHNSKLDKQKVLFIRNHYKHNGWTLQKLADAYDVCPTTIRDALMGKTWMEV